MRRFKVALRGDKGAGKDSLISRWYTGDYGKGKVGTLVSTPASLGQIVLQRAIPYQTNKGSVILDFTYEKEVDVEILIFDLTSMDSLRSLNAYIEEREVKVPIIICGNKMDLGRSRAVTRAIRQLLLEEEGSILCYYDISARSTYNIDKPVIAIIRHFMGEDVVLQAR